MQLIPNPLVIPVGILVGVLVAAPVGPVNVLCVQRAIERGFWGGVAAGLGSVLGDGLIALSAAMGVGTITGAVERHRPLIQFIGGLALIGFGLKLFLEQPRMAPSRTETGRDARLGDFAWDIPKTFFLTITNPGAVLGLFAIFAGVSTYVGVKSHIDALAMVASVMAGSLAWWVLLSNFVGRIRHRLSAERLKQINQVAGLLLGVFGGVLAGEILLTYTGVI